MLILKEVLAGKSSYSFQLCRKFLSLLTLTGTTYQSTFRQRTDSVIVPLVSHAEYQLFTISEGGRVSFHEDDNNDRGRWDELELPDGELGEQIQRKYLNKDRVILNVLRTMGEEKIVGMRSI